MTPIPPPSAPSGPAPGRPEARRPDARRALQDIATFFRRLQWGLLLLVVGALLWALTPVLTPFAAALLLAWLGDPVVVRLQARGLSRNAAVSLVFTAMLLVLALLIVGLVPLIQTQVQVLGDNVPTYLDWFLHTALPWVQTKTGLNVTTWLDPDYLIEMIKRNWQGAGGIASQVLGVITHSGFTVLGWVANLVLIPFLTFFFLRDWNTLVQRAAGLVPRARIATVATLARESDAVLGSFLRGQFMVMLSMGLFYAAGLWMVGLDVGVVIGLVAGLLTFIPYIGPLTVLLGGSIAALVQFGDWPHLVGVLAVWGIGQLLESYVLTPKLVGDRVGLGPVTVVFAVMAGGTLFGFLGMLLALPVASVANVLIRYAHARYTESRFYLGAPPAAAPEIAIVDAPHRVPGRGGGPGPAEPTDPA